MLRKQNLEAETRESKNQRLRVKASKLTAREAARLNARLSYLEAYGDQLAIDAMLADNKSEQKTTGKAYQTLINAIENHEAKIRMYVERRLKNDMVNISLWWDKSLP